MAIRILSGENITGDITTSGKVNAGDRIKTEATTSNALLQVKYNSSNYLEGYYDKLNVVGGDFLIQRSGDTKIQLTSVGTTFTNLSNTSAASSSADEVKIGTFGAGRPAIFLGTSNTTYTNSTWFIENIGASGKFRIGRNGLDVLEIENGGASTFKGSSVTVLNASDPSVAVSDTDTNYKGIMTWRNSGSENVLEFVTRYAGTYYTNNLVLDRGNVGIGTSSPDQTGYGYNTLTIMGGTTAGYAGVLELLTPSTDANGQNLGIVSFGSGGTRNAMIGANRDSANNDGRLSFWTSPGSGGIVERMRITSAGAIEIKGSSTSASAQGFITNDNSKLTIGSAVSGSVVKDIQFNSPTPMMYIDGSTASVGIGTTSPNEKLEVSGSVKIGNMKFEPSSGGRIGFNRNTSNGVIYDSNYPAFQINGANASANYLDFQNYNSSGGFIGQFVFLDGKMGIGTDAPNAKLEVITSTAGYASIIRNTNSANDSNGLLVKAGTGATEYALKVSNTNDTTNFMSVKGNGSVGIGTSSPETNTLLHLKKNAAANTTVELLRLDCGENSHASSKGGKIVFRDINVYNDTATIEAVRLSASSASTLNFRLRNSANGPILALRSDHIAQFQGTSTSDIIKINSGTELNANVGMIIFQDNGGTYLGQITGNSATTTTSYLSASDYRLKEDLKDFNGLDLVSNIKVYDFKWKAANERTYGVMAHELNEVIPQAVNGKKDAERMQSADYSKIVPVLVKAIQELKAEIDLLKNK